MSRKENTEAEDISGTALLDHLRKEGQEVSLVEREINDRPDLLLNVGPDKVGCECVQIPPGRIFKYVHSRFKQLENSDSAAVRVIWPLEQHFWVKEAIESKTKKTSAYKRNTGAEIIWLLIHAPISEKDTTVRYDNDQIMGLIKHAANKTPHSFERIYFWDPINGIRIIFPANNVWESVNFNFDDGYPTDGFTMAKGKFTTTKEGDEVQLYDYGLVTPDEIIVPPLCPEFKKHKPRYKRKKYRIKILAGATDAKFTFEPVDEEP
ncbi:MAG: hypothetical protein AB2687_10315 [Candidatus Thiodiazotropha taylori]